MSQAGIQSNRGDGYQTLVAFEWALTVLSDSNFQWIEIDSTTTSVDDVVIGTINGDAICCQCKKNQPQHKSWSVADLSDELRKASSLLTSNPKAVVRFYSRTPFGELAALREYHANYSDESTYTANLRGRNKKTDIALRHLIVQPAPGLSTYEFLQRTHFETSAELDRMQTLLLERLHRLVSNASAAYDALWTRLDQLGMRMDSHAYSTATQHRLTKDDLRAILAKAGSMLTPTIDAAETRAAFEGTSAVGRSWRTDIGGQRISIRSMSELIEAIESRHRSILLTGLPGSGKTCVMLAAQEELENRARTRVDLVPLFIQSREFADFASAQDRQAQGLPEQWVEKAARIAEEAHVVVMIDSLDVLSIAREHSVLTYFLAQIDRLLLVPNVTVVTACRDFDSHYDRRIAQRSWSKKITCVPLDWDAEIAPLLFKLGIDASAADATTRELIRNPRELALFVELAQQGGSFNVVTSQALAQRYLDTIVRADAALGDLAMQAIEGVADEMLTLRSLAVPHQRFSASQDMKRALLSNKLLHETQDGQLAFGHQTLLDVLVISGAIRQAVNLKDFIQRLPPVPFVRPSIRSFVVQLALGDRRKFRKHLRAVLTGDNAFHIRRLVAETFAEQAPHDEDWPLLRDLRDRHRDVFQVIYLQATRVEWHRFWMTHLVPFLKDLGDVGGLTIHVHRTSQWTSDDAAGVLTFWAEVLTVEGVDKAQLGHSIAHAIAKLQTGACDLAAPVLAELLKLPHQQHSFLGHALARCIEHGGLDDATLWRYIAGEIEDNDVLAYRFDKKLRCHPNEFGNSNNTFLTDRMCNSTSLLDFAVASVEQWSRIKTFRFDEVSTAVNRGFLNDTSYEDSHTQNDHRHLDNERILMDAIEAAIVNHASTQSDWWLENRERLCVNQEGALRYFAILACTAAPIANVDVIGRMLCDKALLESPLCYELGTLMQTALVHLDADTQDTVQATVLSLHEESESEVGYREWLLKHSSVPTFFRGERAAEARNRDLKDARAA